MVDRFARGDSGLGTRGSGSDAGNAFVEEELEAPPGFEPGMELLQSSALPLGDGADQVYVRLAYLGFGEGERPTLRSWLANHSSRVR